MKPLISLLLCLGYAVLLPAQWNNNTLENTMVIYSPVNDYLYGETVSDGAGGSIIFYYADGPGNERHIYTQRITNEGEKIWGDPVKGLPVYTGAKNSYSITPVSDGNGGVIAAWVSEVRYDSSDIFYQHISSTGVVSWQLNGVKLAGNLKVNYIPQMCPDGSGGAYISWSSTDWATNNQTYIQHIGSNGQVLWAEKGIKVCNGPGFRDNIGIVRDAAGNVIIAFRDSRNDPNGIDYALYYNNQIKNWDIYAQKVNSNGILQWADTGYVVCNAPGIQSTPFVYNRCLQPDGNGGAVIAFTDGRNGRDYNYDIYAQRINSNGDRLWQNNGIPVVIAQTNQWGYDALDLENWCSDGAGGLIATWDKSEMIDDIYYIGRGTFCQKINADGTQAWQQKGIKVGAGDWTLNPGFNNTLKDEENNFVITGIGVDANYNKVVNAHKINGITGEEMWGTGGIVVSNNKPRLDQSVLMRSDNNSFIVCWTDDRYSTGSLTDSDIFGAKILSNGTLAVTATPYKTIADGNWNNAAVWENNIVPPADASVLIKHRIIVSQNTSCKKLKTEGPGAQITVNSGVNLSILQ